MKAFTELNLTGLLEDGCQLLEPFIGFVHLYKATDGHPCRKCEHSKECKAKTIHFAIEGLTNKEIARRDGISISEVRRRKESGVYDN